MSRCSIISDDDQKGIKKKINLLGAPGVGKTSLILRFVKSIFDEEYLKTIGTNVYKKNVALEGGETNLIIYDIMGEETYESVQEGAFTGSTGALAVADITRAETLNKLTEEWLPKYKKIASEENPIILAVNKFDLEQREIDSEKLKGVSDHFDMCFYTSAKTGRNVGIAFKILASKVASNLRLSIIDIEDMVEAKIIDTPQRLLDALLAYSSELGELSYESRESILKESGVPKFDLEEELEELREDEVINFADGLVEWYRDHGDEYSAEEIENLIDEYKVKSD